MNLLDIKKRSRSLTRDFSNSIFREEDIVAYANESIDRIKQVIPELRGMNYLNVNGDVPILLPIQYHSIIPAYVASRLFGQDERHYQSTSFMNEFEQKLDEMLVKIQGGDLVITNPDGTVVDTSKLYPVDHVVDAYFTKTGTSQEELLDDDTVV